MMDDDRIKNTSTRKLPKQKSLVTFEDEEKSPEDPEEEDTSEGYESLKEAIGNNDVYIQPAMDTAVRPGMPPRPTLTSDIPTTNGSTSSINGGHSTHNSNGGNNTPHKYPFLKSSSFKRAVLKKSASFSRGKKLATANLPRFANPKNRNLLNIMYLVLCVMLLSFFAFSLMTQKLMAYAIHNPTGFVGESTNTASNTAGSTNDNVVYDTSTTATATTAASDGINDAANAIGNEATTNVITFESTYLTPEQSIHLQSLRNILSPTISTTESLRSYTYTPQYKALYWLAFQDERRMVLPSTSRDIQKLSQRYILALLYFATGGENWTHVYQFLSGLDECEWNGNNDEEYVGGVGSCNGDGLVQTVALWKNNLKGQLPMELGELSAVKVLSLYSNQLTGTLPANFVQMKSLDTFYLHENDFIGDIGFMCSSLSITYFRSDCYGEPPEVSCPCCDVCCAKDDATGESQCFTK
mmetsp:Transcript_19040/g.27535  ORF Transcript_19040/g.27535 Transcript_19040/m.27535 type:complete len:468 (+) Transcript_19040:110-1513(+)